MRAAGSEGRHRRSPRSAGRWHPRHGRRPRRLRTSATPRRDVLGKRDGAPMPWARSQAWTRWSAETCRRYSSAGTVPYERAIGRLSSTLVAASRAARSAARHDPTGSLPSRSPAKRSPTSAMVCPERSTGSQSASPTTWLRTVRTSQLPTVSVGRADRLRSVRRPRRRRRHTGGRGPPRRRSRRCGGRSCCWWQSWSFSRPRRWRRMAPKDAADAREPTLQIPSRSAPASEMMAGW